MSIVIITIIGVIAGMGFVEMAKAYVLSKKNATVAQQGQITAARLKKELSASSSITCGGSNMITYTIKRDVSEDTTTIYWSGGNNPIMLKTASNCTVCTSSCAGGDKLVENVSDFTLSYCTTTTNCSATFPNSPNFTAATVSLMKVILKLKGYEDMPISIADPDFVIFGLESGS
jgi:uncharacterized membrane protein